MASVPKTITRFLADLSLIGDVSEILSKLADFRQRLEDEMRKIDAFKRELPLSVLLINDAIKILKDEEMQYRRRNHQPVLEEFMPLKKAEDEDEDETVKLNKDIISKDKKNWLSSAQLWNADDTKGVDLARSRRRNPVPQMVMKDVKEEFKSFGSSFKACPMVSMGKTRKEEKVEETAVPALSLVIPGMKNSFKEDESSFKINNGGKGGSSSTSSLQPNSRKQRRCWSPELHRQFVNALQQLGGSHVATPKQIRELMQVDGLTNDEVKSHLQKYRLHTRKASNRSMVLFMDQDQYSESSKQSSSQSASPHGPFDLPAANGGGTSLEEEEDEDEKSESYDWKIQVCRSRKVDV